MASSWKIFDNNGLEINDLIMKNISSDIYNIKEEKWIFIINMYCFNLYNNKY